jgi:hypothetical protein
VGKTRGQVNYEGYHAGMPFANWDELSVAEQARWETGAKRVEERFTTQFREVMEALWDAAKPLITAAAAAARVHGILDQGGGEDRVSASDVDEIKAAVRAAVFPEQDPPDRLEVMPSESRT